MDGITVEMLKRLVRLDHATGKMYWRERPVSLFPSERTAKVWNSRYAGEEAFASEHEGYLQGSIFGRKYGAHRVLWALIHGEWPDGKIDHIDGNPANNELSNLRVVSHQENCRNQKRPKSNVSGVAGVGFHKQTKKWRARITVDFQQINLGVFPDFESAVAARRAAEIAHGFHPNHGRG